MAGSFAPPLTHLSTISGPCEGPILFLFQRGLGDLSELRRLVQWPELVSEGLRLFLTELLQNRSVGKGDRKSIVCVFEGTESLTNQAGIRSTRKPEGGAKARKSAVSRGNEFPRVGWRHGGSCVGED
jgi:hypothetical protein